MKKIKDNQALLSACLLITVIIAALVALPAMRGRVRGGYAGYFPADSAAGAVQNMTWAEGVKRVKEDRGEPVGRQAKVETPQQLRHYSDTRRFLAVQVAEWREHRLAVPRDFVDLAGMIRRGEMVLLDPLSRNYILLGVGGNASQEPFTRYENGKSIPLYSETELAEEYAAAAGARAQAENELGELKKELGEVARRERSRRAALQARVREAEKSLGEARDRQELLDRYYGTPETLGRLRSDYESLEAAAQTLLGREYDISDARSRREMKVRMLGALRPAAFKVLDEVAASYREKFGRPLPVTSLVRSEEYQRELSKVNSNATRIAVPPHSTGLAFDILYQYMSAEEQAFVMMELARMKDEGRIEVLRENRDCYHVFAFVDGTRPQESSIRASLGATGAAD